MMIFIDFSLFYPRTWLKSPALLEVLAKQTFRILARWPQTWPSIDITTNFWTNRWVSDTHNVTILFNNDHISNFQSISLNLLQAMGFLPPGTGIYFCLLKVTGGSWVILAWQSEFSCFSQENHPSNGFQWAILHYRKSTPSWLPSLRTFQLCVSAMTVGIVTKSLRIYQKLQSKTAHHKKTNAPEVLVSKLRTWKPFLCPSCCIKHPTFWGLGELLRTRVWRMGLESATGTHSLATLCIWHLYTCGASFIISPLWVWNKLQGHLKPLSIWGKMFFSPVFHWYLHRSC